MSSSSCCFLTCIKVSQETGKMVWYSHVFKNFSYFVIHTVRGFSVVNEAETDIFFWIPLLSLWSNKCLQFDLRSFAFSKPSLYIWKFSVHILLESSLKDFEHNLTSMWNKYNCMVVWTFFGIEMKTDLFHCGHCWVFQISWHTECSTFTASSFRICNRSARIPSPPLALFVVMLSKAHLK